MSLVFQIEGPHSEPYACTPANHERRSNVHCTTVHDASNNLNSSFGVALQLNSKGPPQNQILWTLLVDWNTMV